MKKLVLSIAAIVAMVFGVHASLVSRLTFDDPDHLLKAEVGSDGIAYANSDNNTAVMQAGLGGLSASTDPLSPVRGGGVIKLPERNFLAVPHGVDKTANKPWCLVMKFFTKPEHSKSYSCLYSLNMSNSADGWMFMKSGSNGFAGGQGGWGTNYADANSHYGVWNTMILAIPETTGKPIFYLNGSQYRTSTATHWLNDKDYIYIGADNDGEDGTIYVDEIEVYDEAYPAKYFAEAGVMRAATTENAFPEARIRSVILPVRSETTDGGTAFTLQADAIVTLLDQCQVALRWFDAQGVCYKDEVLGQLASGEAFDVEIGAADRVSVELSASVNPKMSVSVLACSGGMLSAQVSNWFLGEGAVSGVLSFALAEKGQPLVYQKVADLSGTYSTPFVKTVTGLADDTDYVFAFKIVNDKGLSTESSPIEFTTAAAFYVDALAAAGGDGTLAAPFQTLHEAATNVPAGGNCKIFVRSGVDRTYYFNSSNDFVLIDQPNVTIENYGDESRAKIELSINLSSAELPDPYPIEILSGGDDMTIRGLDITAYGSGMQMHPHSLGKSGMAISTLAHRTLVENCRFVYSGSGQYGYSGSMVGSRALQGETTVGDSLTIRGCEFQHVNSVNAYCVNAITGGHDTHVLENRIEDMPRPYFAGKRIGGDFQFISNRLVRCGAVTLYGGNYGDLPNGELAYNIIVGEGEEPAIRRATQQNPNNGNWKVHHNTCINVTSFIYSDAGKGYLNAWKPAIYDNLVILAEGGSMFYDTGTVDSAKLPDSGSPFNEGASFGCNAYLTGFDFAAGYCTTLPGYDNATYLAKSNNVELTSAPVFLSTDLDSDNAYRYKASLYPNLIPAKRDYIGAVAPIVANGLFLYIR